MWHVLPKLGVLKFIFTIFSLLLITTITYLFGDIDTGTKGLDWSDIPSLLKLVGPVFFVYIFFIFILGKWVWRVFWKMPLLGPILNRSICPDLNGKWTGLIESNYKQDGQETTRKEVSFTIKADMFKIHLELDSVDKYQKSKVIQSHIYKDSRTDTFYISYIYESLVPIPKDTDDRSFEGAAKLEVVFDDSMTLSGTYWTNRAWQRRLNTAGSLLAKRSS